jgi:predicted ATPase with chaperone activity
VSRPNHSRSSLKLSSAASLDGGTPDDANIPIYGAAAASPVNAAMDGCLLDRFCELDASGRTLLESAFDRLGLHLSSREPILKLARTIADLAGSEAVRTSHLAEAIQYRPLDRRSA